MTRPAPSQVSYRVLLVGIDAYATNPLRGCVNDIDAVQRILLGRLAVPPHRILRLASPHRGTRHETAIPEHPATLENIRSAFAALAEESLEGDRVFIYYSGHGLRRPIERAHGSIFHRESLAPVDIQSTPEGRPLYDHEINGLLARIAARTPSVTVVLDCCHSAGATRDPGRPEMTARVLDVVRDLRWTTPLPDPFPDGPRGGAVARTVDHCHVVSACLNHELAQETASDGQVHGLLTSAFVGALEGIADAELRSIPWARIWQKMRASVESQNPWQHLWMSGDPSRAVFAGPPTNADAGLSLRRVGDRYEIDAGTLASVTESALVAVYGELPPRFAPVDSPDDLAARRGLLRVTSAGDASATAVIEGIPFELPPGARGRIVKPGAAARLRCAIVPARGEAVARIAAALEASRLLQVVEPRQAQVRLEQVGDLWLLTDDVHLPHPGAALFALSSDQLGYAREILEHYFYYALPLRMADRIKDLPGALQLTVLACPGDRSAREAQDAFLKDTLPEVPTLGTSVYDVVAGARVCFRVVNTWEEPLRVTLVNSAASGRVQLLGDQVIDRASSYVFWAGNILGNPFAMTAPAGRQQGVDRLTALGTTAMATSVAYLRVDKKFADVLASMRGHSKDLDDSPEEKSPPTERWTATQAILKTRAR